MSTSLSSPVGERRDNEVAAASQNGNAGSAWLASEAFWLGTTFVKLFCSIIFVRALSGIFNSGYANKEIYDKASDLMVFGKKPRPYTIPSGSGGIGGVGAAPSSSAGPSGTNGTTAPQQAKFVKQVGQHKLWHHATRIRPDHDWACPIINHKEACVQCFFRVQDKKGQVFCAAIEKLRLLLSGEEDGSDLYEVRNWIKAS